MLIFRIQPIVKRNDRVPLASILATGACAFAMLSPGAAIAQGSHGSSGGQGAGKVSFHDISYVVPSMSPINPNLPLANESVEVALLVPAVQKVREAASRLKLQGEGWSMELPVMGGLTEGHRFFKLWYEYDSLGRLTANVGNRQGTLKQMLVPSTEVAIQILPAVQSDGNVYQVEFSRAYTQGFLGGVSVGAGDVGRDLLIGGRYLSETTSPNAQFQNNLKQMSLAVHGCGSIDLQPIDPNLPFADNDYLETKMLLPAVQKVREAASRMQLVGDGWQLEIPLLSSDAPSHRTVRTYVGSANGGVWKVSNYLSSGEVYEILAPSKHFAVRILPAVQSDGRYYEAQGATFQHHSTMNLVMSDGSVRGVRNGMLVPAVKIIK